MAWFCEGTLILLTLHNLLFPISGLPKYNYFGQAPAKNTQEPVKKRIAKCE